MMRRYVWGALALALIGAACDDDIEPVPDPSTFDRFVLDRGSPDAVVRSVVPGALPIAEPPGQILPHQFVCPECPVCIQCRTCPPPLPFWVYRTEVYYCLRCPSAVDICNSNDELLPSECP